MSSSVAHLIRLALRLQRPALRRLHHPRQLGVVERAMRLGARLPRESEAAHVTVGGAPALELRNQRTDRRSGATLVYVHGGGFATGSPDTHRGFAARLMQAGRFESAVMPRYRLAPRHAFPAGLDDLQAFWEALLATHRTPHQIALAGESAGANLCLALSLRARERGVALPTRIYLHSPWLDLSLSGDSYADPRIDDGFTGRHPERREWLHHVFARHYAGARDPREPQMSPLFADLHGLPPICVDSGADELFLDDTHTLHARCTEAGTACLVTVWPGMWHGFALLAPLLPEGTRAIVRAGHFLAGAPDAS